MRHEVCVFHPEGTIRFCSNKIDATSSKKKPLVFSLRKQSFSMPAPYSLDLRWRFIELHFVENKTKRSIARHLRISTSTVHRILQRLAEYGHVRPARIGRPDIAALLTRAQLLVLMEHVLNNPTSYLKEMEQYLIDSTGSSSNLVGLHRILATHTNG